LQLHVEFAGDDAVASCPVDTSKIVDRARHVVSRRRIDVFPMKSAFEYVALQEGFTETGVPSLADSNKCTSRCPAWNVWKFVFCAHDNVFDNHEDDVYVNVCDVVDLRGRHVCAVAAAAATTMYRSKKGELCDRWACSSMEEWDS
jgi:hypothetical protein